LKVHGGVAKKDVTQPNPEAVRIGIENLKKHIENIHAFNIPVVVAVNRFSFDTDEEINIVKEKCDYLGVDVILCTNWQDGGQGSIELAKAVTDLCEKHTSDFKLLYDDNLPLLSKITKIATEMYGANEILADKQLRKEIESIENQGFGHLPVCMAKTPGSLSTDPNLKGRPTNFGVPLRGVRLASGAGYIVVLTGDIITMPGLPKRPAAELIDVDDNGLINGLS
jgi:formate--tetrahydrofolate ligase